MTVDNNGGESTLKTAYQNCKRNFQVKVERRRSRGSRHYDNRAYHNHWALKTQETQREQNSHTNPTFGAAPSSNAAAIVPLSLTLEIQNIVANVRNVDTLCCLQTRVVFTSFRCCRRACGISPARKTLANVSSIPATSTSESVVEITHPLIQEPCELHGLVLQ